MRRIQIDAFPLLSGAGQAAFNTLCAHFSFMGEKIKKILITSAREGEGKTFVAMNMLRTMADQGKKAVLVEADLRKGSLMKAYGMRTKEEVTSPGLAHYLAGMNEMEDVIYKTNWPGAYIVPAGWNVSNPLTLIDSDRLPALLDALSARADYVIVDTPSAGEAMDAARIARACDGILLVIGQDRARFYEVNEVKHRLAQSGCPLLGAVLNQGAQNR